MELIEFGPDDDAAVAAYVGLCADAHAVDEPWEAPLTVHRQVQVQRHGFDGELGRYFVFREAGEVVAGAALHASDYDNTDLTWIEFCVHPTHRRRGHGTTVLDLLLDECRRDRRSLVVVEGWDGAAARGFAAATGFERKLEEVRRALDLDGSDLQCDRFSVLLNEAASDAGEYVVETYLAPTPAHLLPDLVAVVESINDAPTDGLDYEDERYDVDRIRAYERSQLLSGHRLHRIVARHRRTGELAGHTVVSVDASQPGWAAQHDTSVVPGHRGHRLGLLLKSAMALHLIEVEPDLRTVLTENAVSNGPMIAVNEALGMREVGRKVCFQRRLLA